MSLRQKKMVLKQLDKQLSLLKSQDGLIPPKQGWVRTIRKALGMTINQLAHRLNVSSARVVQIETSECTGNITLQALKKAADQLNCRLVYALIPNCPLEELVSLKAKEIAKKQVLRMAHTMDLESQSVDKEWIETQIADAVQELLSHPWKQLWEE